MASDNTALDHTTDEPTSAVAPSSPNPKQHVKTDSNSSSIESSQDDNSPVIKDPPAETPIKQEEPTEEELRAMYPPDDARAMSPRRSSAETDQMLNRAQMALHL